jgi:hypothetical protein
VGCGKKGDEWLEFKTCERCKEIEETFTELGKPMLYGRSKE